MTKKRMKKFIYSIMVSGALLFATTSCEDSVDDPSVVTYFAELTLNGEDFIKLSVGDTYTEPGYTATEGEEDITDRVVISGTVDTTTPGFYDLTYSVANTDGFSVTDTRQVMVVDPNNFASAYFGETAIGSRHYTDAPVVISDNGDGTYTIDDLLGGFQWYGLNPGFEPTYDFHAEAIITLNADNTISLQEVGSWSSDALGITDPLTIQSGSYDPATGVITLAIGYAGSTLSVTLTK